MSPWEFRTYTVARGPQVRSGVTIDTPTGHPDLAPTLLRLIGREPAPSMEGRVIEDLFSETATSPHPPAVTHRSQRAAATGTYRQELTVSGGHLVAAAFSRDE